MQRKIDKEKVRNLYQSGWPVRHIARHLGFTYSGIRQRLLADRIEIDRQRAMKFKIDRIRKLYVDEKRSASETYRTIGISPSTFYRIVSKTSIPLRSWPKLHTAEIVRLYVE